MKSVFRIIPIFLAVCIMTNTVLAVSDEYSASITGETILYCDDGSFITITLNKFASETRGTIGGTKTYTCTKDGSVVWTAVLTATFNYTGYSSGCTGANCQVTFQNNQYSLQDKTVTVSGNTAIATITVVHKVLGITISTATHTLTLSCDSNGNLS